MTATMELSLFRVADELARCPILLAEQLKARIAAHDLQGAYRVLDALQADPVLVNEVLLRAGLPTVGVRARDFWAYAQASIARSCRAGTPLSEF